MGMAAMAGQFATAAVEGGPAETSDQLSGRSGDGANTTGAFNVGGGAGAGVGIAGWAVPAAIGGGALLLVLMLNR